MDFATYWLVVPTVGIGLTLPIWAWLFWTRRRAEKLTPKEADELRTQAAAILMREAAEHSAKARELERRAEDYRKRRSGEEPDLFWRPPGAPG